MTNVNLYSRLIYENEYKLLQLTPDLLVACTDKDKTLKFKSLDNDSAVVICSDDKTWLLKQKNHSNLVMLMKEFKPENLVDQTKIKTFGLHLPNIDWLGFSTQSFELEPRVIQGQIDISKLPIYDGYLEFPRKNDMRISLQELEDSSPCSKLEFYQKWYTLGGSQVNGIACILSDDFISRTLHIILISILAESLDRHSISLDSTYVAVSKDMTDENYKPYLYTKDVIETLLNKFGDHNKNTQLFNIDDRSVSIWYGISALKKFAMKQPILEDEFMVKWKSLFPPYFICDIDIVMLRGTFSRPLKNRIQYLSKNNLSMVAKTRFIQLFKIQSSWDLDDIIPFIDDLNIKGININSFIMKYAKRRKIGNNIVITSK